MNHPSTLARTAVWGAALALFVSACGGGSDAESADGDEPEPIATTAPATTPIPDPGATADAVVIPTSTPLPTATPLPTSTPIPLDSPTPSAILLGSAFTNDSKVTTVGIDEVFFGMGAEEAAEAASTTWVGESSSGYSCYRVVPETGPEGIVVWIVDGFVERLDIRHPDLRTPSKLGVGNSLEELQGQLGDRLSDETAEDGSVIATFTPSDEGDRDFRIVFNLVDDRVVNYRTGRVGVIDLGPEDCFSSLQG